MKVSEETCLQCVFALTEGNFSGYYRFKKGFYGLADKPLFFTRKLNEHSDTVRRHSWTT